MTLGTQDEQPAHFPNSVCRRPDLCLVPFYCPDVPLTGFQYFLIVCVCKAYRFHQDLFRHTSLEQLGPGQELSITTQHNVRTTASHVSSNSDGSQFAGLGYDLSLALVVLGI